MITGARLVQLTGNVDAIREEARRLQHTPKFLALAFCPRLHAELAHVREDLPDVIEGHLHDALQAPARSEPRVLMQEKPPLGPLVLIDAGAELHVPLDLLHPVLELCHPHLAASVHKLVQLLEAREQRAWR